MPIILALAFAGTSHTQVAASAAHHDRRQVVARRHVRTHRRAAVPVSQPRSWRQKRNRRRGHRIITRFDLCTANREKGEPGSLDPRLIHWHADAEGYEGAYSWLNSTWLSQGGGRYAEHAYEASPRDQSRIFNVWSRRDPGAWPNTVPPCLYLRR